MFERTSTVRFTCGIVAVLFAAAPVGSRAAGIKETTRLTITGPGVAKPIVVTDERVLTLSNVYSGTFIGEPVSEPPDNDTPRFAITFDVQSAQGIKASAYTVTFVKSRWTSEAFVYIPGPRDDSYRRNISTILRTGVDGQWHHASEQWAQAISARLP
jgi:hypothetical protein